MKKIKLTEIEKHLNVEKLSNNELCNLVGAGCGACCGDSGSSYRKDKRYIRKNNDNLLQQ